MRLIQLMKNLFRALVLMALFFLQACTKDTVDEQINENTSAVFQKSGTIGDVAGHEIWWWAHPSLPYATNQTLGNITKERKVLAGLKYLKINNLYGCYAGVNNPELLRHWNSLLANNRIVSELLLSENTWIFPEYRNELLDLVQISLVDFNNACRSRAQQFKALHLDIEPHGIAGWDTLDSDGKKLYLKLLSDTYRDVRELLNANGMSWVKLNADLPDWFDAMDNSIGWVSEKERNEWFFGLSRNLASVSLMAYEKSTLEAVMASTSWERKFLPCTVVVGLNFRDHGWNGCINQFLYFAGELEKKISNHIAFHSYEQMASQVLPMYEFAGQN